MAAGLRHRTRLLLEGHGRHGVLVEGGTYVLTIVAAVVFAAATMPELARDHARFFAAANVTLSLLFLAEYLLRVWSAERRLAYILSPWGLIDLAATLPVLMLFNADIAGVRALRLVRLAGLMKLLRMGNAGRRMGAAVKSIAPELATFFCFATVTLYLAAYGIYFFENDAQPQVFSSIPASLWWAVITLTTVGYGDVYPVTVGGRIFTGFVLLTGLAIIAVPTGLFSTALIEARQAATDAIPEEPQEPQEPIT